MCHTLFPDVHRSPESREVRAHQRREIDCNTGDGKPESHPSIAGDAFCQDPVRRDGDQIARHQPDADVWGHAEDHGYSRKSETEKRQSPVIPRITKQDRYVALFLLFHCTLSFLYVLRFSPFRLAYANQYV